MIVRLSNQELKWAIYDYIKVHKLDTINTDNDIHFRIELCPGFIVAYCKNVIPKEEKHLE